MPSFRLPWGFALLALCALAVALWAAHWQGDRAQARTALRSAWLAAEAAPPVALSAGVTVPAYRHVAARGHWLADDVVYLNNRALSGQVGVYVVMAFQVDQGPVVAVNRGWLSHPPGAPVARSDYATPAGPVQLSGIALDHEPQYLALGGAGAEQLGGLWQNFDPAGFARAIGRPIAPYIVREEGGPGDGLTRSWPDLTADLEEGIERNHGYVFQWYAIAAAIVAFTVYFGFRHGRKNES